MAATKVSLPRSKDIQLGHFRPSSRGFIKGTARVLAVLFLASLAVCTQGASPQGSQLPETQTPGPGPRGVVQGAVEDSSGGIIPGATVTLLDPAGTAVTTSTRSDGMFTFRGVAPGTYSVTVSYDGLEQSKPLAVNVLAGHIITANLSMTVQEQKQEVTVNDSTENQITTEASSNATALVLKKEDLDSLPDDPDDLEADLQALAGPSAGPGGNQIYVDGFTGGRLPSKESIREIRVNSNPFSAEFDKLGYGRVQIFTKPGSDKFHGQGYYTISDGIWNSRNPFLAYNPAFRTQMFGGNVSGPISQKGSFFVDMDRRNIDDNGIIGATIPRGDFLSALSYQTAVPTPQRRTTLSPRLDYQLNTNNTLSARYSYLANNRILTGVGGFNLNAVQFGNLSYASSGYSTSNNEQTAEIVETAVLGPRAVNETHFQYERRYTGTVSKSATSKLIVGQSFTAGGSGFSAPGYASNYNLQNSFEVQNYTSFTWGAHTSKFGLRVRSAILDDKSARNFNGSYQFLGNATTSSIQQYLTTIQLLNRGMTSGTIADIGYGPSKYTVNSGIPYFGLSQIDLGPFFQDDWRARPDLTVSVGVRFETQTNIPDHNDWAARVGVAWLPGGTNSKSKLVIRGGWGMFYDRLAATNVEQALRYSQGGNLSSYTVNNPTIFDASFATPLPLGSLIQLANSSQRYQIDAALRSPYLMQATIGLECQVLSHTTLGVNFLSARGVHELRTVDINAPVPTFGSLPPGVNPFPLTRPYGAIGDIYDYQSTGIYKQNQLLINVNSQAGRWLTLFSRYSTSRAHSDTDGLGTLPSNPYNLRADWGRASTNIDHSLFAGGSISAKWGLRFSPFMVMRSGVPYNITTGTDLYLQGTGTPTARPGISNTPTPYYAPGIGYLNPTPLVGTPLITRNVATGFGNIGLNLRVSKTWGFGSKNFSGPSGGSRAGGHGGGGFGGGPHGMGVSESTEHRYNVTLSANARNVINHQNLNTPNGSMTSPYFLEATAIAGGFGPESTASNQRRIDIQLRVAF